MENMSRKFLTSVYNLRYDPVRQLVVQEHKDSQRDLAMLPAPQAFSTIPSGLYSQYHKLMWFLFLFSALFFLWEGVILLWKGLF